MNLFQNPLFLIILLGILFLGLLALAILFFFYTKKPIDKDKKENQATRFNALLEIDKENEGLEPIVYEKIGFQELCEAFRSYAASELGLYYSKEDIRRFIAGLATSHIMILQGMSGTGKTSLAYAFGRFIENDSAIIPVQPMWKERTDLIGYYNEFTKKFNETPFLEEMYKANYKPDMHITILDEMNIARVEYYFAEFLSLLEIPDPESRYIDVVSSKFENDPKLLKNGQIKLPDNMWFIGTVNNDDSTFSISDKVYDRAMIMNLDKRATPFDAQNPGSSKISATEFINLARETYKNYSMKEELVDLLLKLDMYLQDNFYISFGNRINRQINQYLAVYIACGGDEMEALDDILAKKVFRKLGNGSAALVKKEIEALFEKLDELFGEGAMPECRQQILRISQTAR
jgi:MoxR-like ATPase